MQYDVWMIWLRSGHKQWSLQFSPNPLTGFWREEMGKARKEENSKEDRVESELID